MTKIQELVNRDGTPFAVYVVGHISYKEFCEIANKGWDCEWATQDNTFYEYAIIKSGSNTIEVNRVPDEKTVPVTIAYWNDPYPEQFDEDCNIIVGAFR